MIRMWVDVMKLPQREAYEDQHAWGSLGAGKTEGKTTSSMEFGKSKHLWIWGDLWCITYSYKLLPSTVCTGRVSRGCLEALSYLSS